MCQGRSALAYFFSQLQSGLLYGGSIICLTGTLGSFPVFFKQCFGEHPCTYISTFLCKWYWRKWHCCCITCFEFVVINCSLERGDWFILPSRAYENCGVFITLEMPKEKEELSEFRPELIHCRLYRPTTRHRASRTRASLCGSPQTLG